MRYSYQMRILYRSFDLSMMGHMNEQLKPRLSRHENAKLPPPRKSRLSRE